MMMAFDSSQTPPSRLIRTHRRLRAVSRSGSILHPARRPHCRIQLARQMAAEAREKSMPPEQLLIALKDIWNGLPEVRAMTEFGRIRSACSSVW